MQYCIELKILPTGFNLKSLNFLSFLRCRKLTTFPVFSTNISYLNLELTAIKKIPSNLYLENLVYFFMGREEENDDVEVEVQQLTLFSMLFPTLSLPGLTNLVELPYSSFKNLHQLKTLCIRKCSNFEIIPTGINLQSLDNLNFSGCSRLKSFPNISTNIKELYLRQTGIEEVPWWIENFSYLKCLSLEECKNLRRVSFNISKLKDIIELNFRDCRALTRVDLCGGSVSPQDNYVPTAKVNLSHCFKLDPESLLQNQLFRFKSMILPGEEVPSYFTHKTVGTSSRLAIPLLNIPHSQSFFRVKICAVVDSGKYSGIQLNFQFKGKFGNCYYCASVNPDPHNNDIFVDGRHLIIYDFHLPRYKDDAPLDQRNYDLVNMKIRVDDNGNGIYNQVLPKFGILLSEYDEDNYDSDIALQPDNGEKYRRNGDSDTDCETENSKEYKDSDTNRETKNGEETGDNNIDRAKQEAKQEANAATQLPIRRKRDSTFVDADEDGMLNMNEPIEECRERNKKPRKVSKD